MPPRAPARLAWRPVARPDRPTLRAGVRRTGAARQAAWPLRRRPLHPAPGTASPAHRGRCPLRRRIARSTDAARPPRRTGRSRLACTPPAAAVRAAGSRARYARSPRHQGPAGTPCRRSSNTSFFSPGAAGKLLHILVEGLRRELQALDHRQVGEQLVGQFLHRHAVANGQGRRLDQLAGFRCNRLHADEPSAVFFNDQLDEAACVEVGERARHVVQRERTAVGLDAVVVRFRLAVAHGGHLRVGEHHGRHGGQVQGSVATGHVDRGTGAGRRCHIDELRLIGAVAGGVDVGATRVHSLVDDDRTLLVHHHACHVQCQAARVGCTAGGDQQLVGAQFAVRRGEHEFAVPFTIDVRDLAGLGVFPHLDAFGTERGRDGFADGRVFAEEQRAARQDRHLRSESSERLRQLQRHHR